MRNRLLLLKTKLEAIAVDLQDEVDEPSLERTLRRLTLSKPHGHSRSLYEHLQGTREVLRSWQQPLWIQLAGLFHSIYSTEAYGTPTINIAERSTLQRLIGNKAERLAYLFGACRRDDVAALIEADDKHERNKFQIKNRFVGIDEQLTGEELFALAILIMANAAEQSCAEDRSPATWLSNVGRLRSNLDSHLGVMPRVIAGFPVGFSRDAELQLIANYRAALRALAGRSSEAEELLQECEKSFPILGEFPAWTAYAAKLRGDHESSKKYAQTSIARFKAWGTSWDKRLSHAAWIKDCEYLSLAASSPDDDPSNPRLSGIRTILSLFGEAAPDRPNDPPDLARLENYLSRFAAGAADNLLVYPLQPGPRFFDAESFPITADLEESFQQVRHEISSLSASSFHAEGERIARQGDWDVCILYERGRRNAEICALCPAITEIIETHDTVRTLAGLIYVSKLAANSRVATHRGPTNLRVRCHLGVQIPKGDCGIRVGVEYQTWREGKCLVFDDFYDHEVWNETNEERVVLIVDLWNPQLSASERRMLAGIHHYTIHQAQNLRNYWANNEKLRHQKRAGYD